MPPKKKVTKSSIKVSATRISAFLQCKLKYKFNYIDHAPRVGSPAFKLGTSVHEALEFAGHIWQDKGAFSDEDIVKIKDKYNEVSVSEGIDSYNIHDEGMDMVMRRVNSFCEPQEKILGLEQLFGMREGVDITTDLGVPLVGAIDKVTEYSSDTLVVIDYKTLKTAPTPDHLREDLQLSLYDIAARKLYPDYKRVILSLDLLRHEPVYTYRTDEERAKFERYLKVVYDAMCNFKPAQDAKASLNQFCAWCDYRDYCDTYREACQKSNYKFMALNSASDSDLFKEWEHIKYVERIIVNRKKEISNLVLNKIRDNGVNLNNEEEELYIRQNSRVDYDVNAIFDSIPTKDLVGVVSIKKSALDKYVDQNPVFKEVVNNAGSVNFNKPFIDKRKLKGQKPKKKGTKKDE